MRKQSPIPIETAHLFSKLEIKLLELLKSLAPEDGDIPALEMVSVMA